MPKLVDTYSIESLSKKHKRADFDCGIPELNDYFINRAGQDMRRNVTSVWVAENKVVTYIAGYYTLAMAAVPLDLLEEDVRKKLPRYSDVPAVKLGRLAVSKNEQGKGLGKFLIRDAMKRCFRNEIAWALFLVDAKDGSARKFYENLGFFSFTENRNHLYMPRTIIEREYFSKKK